MVNVGIRWYPYRNLAHFEPSQRWYHRPYQVSPDLDGKNGVASRYDMRRNAYTVKLDTGETFVIAAFNLQAAPLFTSKPAASLSRAASFQRPHMGTAL